MLAGLYSILNDSDIYVGFLWVIDLGVGLVFFIFMMHFSSFLQQKTTFDVSKKYFFSVMPIIFFLLGYFYFMSAPSDSVFNSNTTRY
jgi:uncharacterized RDD family membrane protein YckC